MELIWVFFGLHDSYIHELFFTHLDVTIATEECHARSQLASIGVGRQQALFATNGGLVDVYLNGPEIYCMFFFWGSSFFGMFLFSFSQARNVSAEQELIAGWWAGNVEQWNPAAWIHGSTGQEHLMLFMHERFLSMQEVWLDSPWFGERGSLILILQVSAPDFSLPGCILLWWWGWNWGPLPKQKHFSYGEWL